MFGYVICYVKLLASKAFELPRGAAESDLMGVNSRARCWHSLGGEDNKKTATCFHVLQVLASKTFRAARGGAAEGGSTALRREDSSRTCGYSLGREQTSRTDQVSFQSLMFSKC